MENRTKIAEEIYNFVCEYYHQLLEEYQRLPLAQRQKIPFPAFCVAFWDEITPKEQSCLEQISAIFDKPNGLN